MVALNLCGNQAYLELTFVGNVNKLITGSKNFDPCRVGSIFCGLGQVSHLWFGFGKFLLKTSNFSIFCPLGQKKYLRVRSKRGQPLIYCGSKVSSGHVRAHLYEKVKEIVFT